MKEITKREIGQRINTALAQKDMKQKDLAQAIRERTGKNITDNTISYFCSGSRLPDYELLIEIASILDVSTDYLLGLKNAKSVDIDIESVQAYTHLSRALIEELHNEGAGVMATLLNIMYASPNHSKFFEAVFSYIFSDNSTLLKTGINPLDYDIDRETIRQSIIDDVSIRELTDERKQKMTAAQLSYIVDHPFVRLRVNQEWSADFVEKLSEVMMIETLQNIKRDIYYGLIRLMSRHGKTIEDTIARAIQDGEL